MIIQVRSIDLRLYNFTELLAKIIGQGLAQSATLEHITVTLGKDIVKTQTLTFHNTHLQLDAVSEHILSLLMQLNSDLLQKVE